VITLLPTPPRFFRKTPSEVSITSTLCRSFLLTSTIKTGRWPTSRPEAGLAQTRTLATLCRTTAPTRGVGHPYVNYNDGIWRVWKQEIDPGQITRPDHHHLDLDPLPIPGITCGTATVSFVHGFSTLRTMEPQYQSHTAQQRWGCWYCGRNEDTDRLPTPHSSRKFERNPNSCRSQHH